MEGSEYRSCSLSSQGSELRRRWQELCFFFSCHGYTGQVIFVCLFTFPRAIGVPLPQPGVPLACASSGVSSQILFIPGKLNVVVCCVNRLNNYFLGSVSCPSLGRVEEVNGECWWCLLAFSLCWAWGAWHEHTHTCSPSPSVWLYPRNLGLNPARTKMLFSPTVACVMLQLSELCEGDAVSPGVTVQPQLAPCSYLQPC